MTKGIVVRLRLSPLKERVYVVGGRKDEKL